MVLAGGGEVAPLGYYASLIVSQAVGIGIGESG